MTRRRLILMRHAEVAYFDDGGRPFPPDEVPLTKRGGEQAQAAARALAGAPIDRVITSGLRRAVETAEIVAPGREPEAWPDFREIRSGRLADLPEDEIEDAFLGAFRGRVPLEARFLGGETMGSLVERVTSALERLVSDRDWQTALLVLHGGVNRAILSFALTGERCFLGGIEQAPACINVVDVGADWVVRVVNYAPYDPLHAASRLTTMEELYRRYRGL